MPRFSECVMWGIKKSVFLRRAQKCKLNLVTKFCSKITDILWFLALNKRVLRIRDVFIPDPDPTIFLFRFSDPDLIIFSLRIRDLTWKVESKLFSCILCFQGKVLFLVIVKQRRDPESENQDPEKIHPGSRIQGVKKHRIPEPQHWFKPYISFL
jgi:hypothetical protein